jgi:hypothetical protein
MVGQWKVLAANGEQELQTQLDELQSRIPKKDEHGEFHIVGTILELVSVGVQPLGTLIVLAKVGVHRDPPLPSQE